MGLILLCVGLDFLVGLMLFGGFGAGVLVWVDLVWLYLCSSVWLVLYSSDDLVGWLVWCGFAWVGVVWAWCGLGVLSLVVLVTYFVLGLVGVCRLARWMLGFWFGG